jgi:hypothetical protein
MMRDTVTVETFFASLVIFGITLFGSGLYLGRSSMQTQALKAGVAEIRINRSNGSTAFGFIECH